MEIWFVIINALAYVVLFFWFYRKKKGMSVGVFVILLWMVSAIGAIVYEPLNFIGHKNSITLTPYIYLFVLNFIMFLPVLKFKEETIRCLKVNVGLFKGLCVFVSIICILPFFENLIYLMAHSSSAGVSELQASMVERYKDVTTTFAYMSRPARFCRSLLGFVGLNILSMLLLLFPLIVNIKNHKLLFGGVILANLTMVIQSINIFARYNIIIHLCLLVFVFLLLRGFYPRKIRKQIVRVSMICFAAFTLIFIVMTLSRLSNRNSTVGSRVGIVAYVAQYMSEAMGNFNATMWGSNKFTNSDRFKYIIENKFTGKVRDRVKETRYLGYYSGAFYTAVGDYYKAYGPYATVLIVIVTTIVFCRICKAKKRMTLSALLLFLLYARLPLLGFFYNTYAVSGDEFLFSLFFIPFAYFLESTNPKTIDLLAKKST